MISKLLLMLLICLWATVVIELLLAYILKIRKKKDFINILLVNVLTNPLVTTIPFYLNVAHSLLYRNIAMIILEIFAVIIEGFVYKKYFSHNYINPYVFSLILNFVSYIIGFFVSPIIYQLIF